MSELPLRVRLVLAWLCLVVSVALIVYQFAFDGPVGMGFMGIFFACWAAAVVKELHDELKEEPDA